MLRTGSCSALRGVGIPDRPRVGLALRERPQRVGGLQEHQFHVRGRQTGPLQLRQDVPVRRAALADRDALAARDRSTAVIGESAWTRILSPTPPPSYAETTLTLALEAAPKIGGVLPVIAKSILPAVAASICGGPEVNVEKAIL